MENKINIWMDCDPGIDDAVAFAAAFANRDKLNICGITSVAGNQTSDRVTNNARRLTAFLGGTDVPVARGARKPLLREQMLAGDVHGETGTGYFVLPETDKPLASENGVLFLYEALMNLPEGEKMTLVPTGPMTNMALLISTFPEVLDKIERVVLMGGAAIGGNVTPTAEFNIWVDPEAAKILFDSGLPIVMCGLDVTHQCGLTRDHLQILLDSKGKVEHAYGEMIRFYFDSPAYTGSDLVCIHDASTILYLTNPELFSGNYYHVDVDCSEGMNRGMTVCDMRSRENRLGQKKNVYVLNKVDQPAFQKKLMEILASYDR